jgi:methylamine dehydrogenase accessory protein MauD
MNSLLIVSHVGLWVLVICLTLGFLVLMRQIALMQRRLMPGSARMEAAGPKVGERAPEVDAVDLLGRRVTLGSARQKQTLLMFVSPECSVCGDVMPAIRSIAKSERKYLEVMLVSLGVSDEANHAYVRRHALEAIPLVASRALIDAYGMPSPPYAVLLGPDQHVQTKGVVNHFEHLESLLNAARIGHPTLESYMAATRTASTRVPTGTVN